MNLELLQADWYAVLLRRALKESSNVEEATRIADVALSMQPYRPGSIELALEIDAELARGSARRIGEVWQGPSKRWFTRNEAGRVVPYKPPEGTHEHHRWKMAKQEKVQQAASGGQEKIKALAAVKDVSTLPAREVAETVKGLAEYLKKMTVEQLNALKKELGVKASGPKAELARKIAQRALTKARETSHYGDVVQSSASVLQDPATKPANDASRSKATKTVSEAETALAALSPMKKRDGSLDPTRVRSPLPGSDGVDLSPEQSDAVTAALKSGDVATEEVKLDGLRLLQPYVYPDAVRKYLDDPNAKSAAGEKVVVIRLGGKDYVYDGTHRATAAKLRGQQTIEANIVDLGRRHDTAVPAKDHVRPVTDAVEGLSKQYNNLIPLNVLQKATGLSLPELHAAINAGRQAGTLTGTADEGRGRIDPALAAAAIEEQPHNIHYVGKKQADSAPRLLV